MSPPTSTPLGSSYPQVRRPTGWLLRTVSGLVRHRGRRVGVLRAYGVRMAPCLSGSKPAGHRVWAFSRPRWRSRLPSTVTTDDPPRPQRSNPGDATSTDPAAAARTHLRSRRQPRPRRNGSAATATVSLHDLVAIHELSHEDSPVLERVEAAGPADAGVVARCWEWLR